MVGEDTEEENEDKKSKRPTEGVREQEIQKEVVPFEALFFRTGTSQLLCLDTLWVEFCLFGVSTCLENL